jgi:hypothetical protein
MMVQRYKKSARYARKSANNLVKDRIRRNEVAKGIWKEINTCIFQKN